MQTRRLGHTDLHLPTLSFGASSLGAEFRSVKLDEALDSVRVALDADPSADRAMLLRASALVGRDRGCRRSARTCSQPWPCV